MVIFIVHFGVKETRDEIEDRDFATYIDLLRMCKSLFNVEKHGFRILTQRGMRIRNDFDLQKAMDHVDNSGTLHYYLTSDPTGQPVPYKIPYSSSPSEEVEGASEDGLGNNSSPLPCISSHKTVENISVATAAAASITPKTSPRLKNKGNNKDVGPQTVFPRSSPRLKKLAVRNVGNDKGKGSVMSTTSRIPSLNPKTTQSTSPRNRQSSRKLIVRRTKPQIKSIENERTLRTRTLKVADVNEVVSDEDDESDPDFKVSDEEYYFTESDDDEWLKFAIDEEKMQHLLPLQWKLTHTQLLVNATWRVWPNQHQL